MNKYKSLIIALQSFQEDWLFDLGLEGCKASLVRQFKEDLIDLEILKEEYQSSRFDRFMNWNELAVQSGLFHKTNIYCDGQILSIIELYLHEVLYPESKLTTHECKLITIYLKSYLDEKEYWVLVSDLVEKLSIKFSQLKPYHFFCYKDYFDINLLFKKANPERMWVVDEIKLADS